MKRGGEAQRCIIFSFHCIQGHVFIFWYYTGGKVMRLNVANIICLLLPSKEEERPFIRCILLLYADVYTTFCELICLVMRIIGGCLHSVQVHSLYVSGIMSVGCFIEVACLNGVLHPIP